jgi:acyl-coenzyme A synthetase/AMP-(fatty) acid ligase
MEFHEIYGSAATGPMSVLRPGDMTGHSASVGRPVSLIDIEVVDDDGRSLEPHIPGQLRCRGPGIASPIESNRSPDDFRQDWYYPGEIAALDERGYIFLQGRTSEVIFRGGAKIVPAEVEAVLQTHHAVFEAAVVGRAAAGIEQEIVAYVVANQPVTSGDILAHCRVHLTAYKVPREIYLVPDLPRTSSGKVDKRLLAAPRG